jgi:multidrug efflux pump subunit AcrA (membrane-fusion protein)
MHDTRFATVALLASAAGVLVVTFGCSRDNTTAAPPLEVEVAPVQQKDVPVYREWIGTLDGLVNADIKAQVTGYLVQQAYRERTFVKQGQLLFQIDPRPFQAAVDQARGQVAQTEGQLEQSCAQLGQAEAQLAVAEANQNNRRFCWTRWAGLCREQEPRRHKPNG